MNTDATPIEALFEKAEDYGKTTVELLKLKAVNKSADLISSVAAQVVTFIVVALFVFIVSIGASLWLGEILGKNYYGFFAVAGFYALLAIAVYLFRNEWIKNRVSDSIVCHFLKK